MHNLAFQSPANLGKAPFRSSLPGVDIFKPKGFTKRKKNKALGLSETRRKPVKFGAIDGLSSGSDDLSDSEFDFDELKAKAKAPWTLSSHSSSTHTLVDGRIGKDSLTDSKSPDHDIDLDDKKLKIQKQHAFQNDPIDTLGYPDYEEDLSTVHHGGDRLHNTVAAAHTEGQNWYPGFLRRHAATVGGVDRSSSSAKLVPATPSLIKAMYRIAVAQRDAFGPPPRNVVSGLPDVNAAGSPKCRREIKPGGEKAARWEDFWREVRVKAQARS